MAHPKLAVASAAGKAAAEKRWYGEASDQTKAELAEAQLEDYIRRIVAAAPPLSAEKADQLALLLRDGAA